MSAVAVDTVRSMFHGGVSVLRSFTVCYYQEVSSLVFGALGFSFCFVVVVFSLAVDIC